ncbi:hypothetical protein JK169_07780 [Acetobacter persici]|uniref:hypothetical protein n=1 Tax=Acetobacter persici TaxID=1076596 RepID=UPI001BAD4AFA|nr:hypothetical protein [Acetobacter persici]MBS1000917.1 hypothetical protein [Acetobacter persici]
MRIIPIIVIILYFQSCAYAENLLINNKNINFAKIMENINFVDYYGSIESLPYSLDPLQKAYDAGKNGDTIFVPAANWPWSNEMFPASPQKTVLFYLLGQAHSGNTAAGTAPPTYITPHSITEGFWNGSVNLQKVIPFEHLGSVIASSEKKHWDYNPLLNISYEVDDSYESLDCPGWCGRQDVPGLIVHAKEGRKSKASSVPIISSIDTYGEGGYFANSVAIKTYTNNYGINASWGIDIRSSDFSGTEPHDDGRSPGGYSLIGEETDLHAYGQDNPNIEFIPFGYRRFYHLGGGLSDTNAASWSANICSYSTGTRIVMPEYTQDGKPVLDPWGHQLRGIFKAKQLRNICAHQPWGDMGRSGVLLPQKWIRGAGQSQMWQQQQDHTYALKDVPTKILPIIDGDVIWEWGEDENATIGTGILLNGNKISTDISKGKAGVQYGAGIYMSGSFLDAAIDLSGIECGIQINDLVSGIMKSDMQAKCASIRIPENIPIDFSATSDNNLSSYQSKNKHTLGYYNKNHSLSYKKEKNTLLNINDLGILTLNPLSKEEIKNQKDAQDGSLAYDKTDHTFVIKIPDGWHMVLLSKKL